MRSASTLTIAFCLIILGSGLTFSCKKKDNKSTPKDDFDRKGMLTNMGNNVIVPAYQALNSACIKLDTTVAAFNSNPDSAKLVLLQSTFKDAYRAWQSASSFGFGPADQEFLSKNMNTFPTDTVKIIANMTSGSYNLNAILNLDAKGLPGIDYLLFGLGSTNAARLIMYTTDANAAKRKQYLAALSLAMRTTINMVLNDWQSGQNYMSTFVSSTGTDVGSSLGQLVNQMDYDLEILKNYKFGVPLGKQSMGTPYPTKVEAYYSGISSELALLQLKSLQAIYLGKGTQGDGLGLDDNLISLGAQYNNGSLDDAIKNQFNAAIGKLQTVSDPFSGAIAANNTAAANAAYTEIQKLVVLLKTDLPSALGVLITYEDTDGD